MTTMQCRKRGDSIAISLFPYFYSSMCTSMGPGTMSTTMSSTASDNGSHRRNTAWARLRLSLVDSSRGGTSCRTERERGAEEGEIEGGGGTVDGYMHSHREVRRREGKGGEEERLMDTCQSRSGGAYNCCTCNPLSWYQAVYIIYVSSAPLSTVATADRKGRLMDTYNCRGTRPTSSCTPLSTGINAEKTGRPPPKPNNPTDGVTGAYQIEALDHLGKLVRVRGDDRGVIDLPDRIEDHGHTTWPSWSSFACSRLNPIYASANKPGESHESITIRSLLGGREYPL